MVLLRPSNNNVMFPRTSEVKSRTEKRSRKSVTRGAGGGQIGSTERRWLNWTAADAAVQPPSSSRGVSGSRHGAQTWLNVECLACSMDSLISSISYLFREPPFISSYSVYEIARYRIDGGSYSSYNKGEVVMIPFLFSVGLQDYIL
jgi:hypothetical protein